MDGGITVSREKISIVVVDDHPVILHGVKSILEKCGDMAVIGEADDGRSGLDLIASMRPDVAILDIALGELSGLDIIPQINRNTVLVIYTAYDNLDYIHKAFQNGVKGYVLKADPMLELATAVREAHSGRIYLSSSISPGVLDQLFKNQ